MQKLQLAFHSPSVRSLIDSRNSLVHRETHSPYIGGGAAGHREHPIQSRAPHGSDGAQGNSVLGEAGEASLPNSWSTDCKEQTCQTCVVAAAVWATTAPLGPESRSEHKQMDPAVQQHPSYADRMEQKPQLLLVFLQTVNKTHKYSLEPGLESRLFLCSGVNNPPHHSLMVNIPIKKILDVMFWSCTRMGWSKWLSLRKTYNTQKYALKNHAGEGQEHWCSF